MGKEVAGEFDFELTAHTLSFVAAVEPGFESQASSSVEISAPPLIYGRGLLRTYCILLI
jgi:hypothetical protein